MLEQKLERDPGYAEEFKRALKIVDAHQDFFLTTHLNPDGDGLGCESALSLALTCLGKTVTVRNAHPTPPLYDFLPNRELFQVGGREERHHEVAIILECPDEGRTGGVIEIPGGADQIINLDHHVYNARYGTVNLVDPTAAAAGEQVWDLLAALDCSVDKRMAVGIYTAIATDTGHFKYASVTPRTHRTVAQLLELGLEVGYLNEQIYERSSAEALHLLALSLCGVKYNAQRNVGWFSVTRQMLAASDAQENQTENFVNYVRAVTGVEVAIFFLEMTDGRIKISFRSRGHVDVAAIAYEFGGGGHRRAAGAQISGPLEAAQAAVVATVEAVIKVKV